MGRGRGREKNQKGHGDRKGGGKRSWGRRRNKDSTEKDYTNTEPHSGGERLVGP